MPIYEYECTNCGKIQEAIQKFSDSPLTTCKSCNGSLQKLISQSSFHLKGSGWYVTDYGGSSNPSSSSTGESSSAKDKASKTSCASSAKSSSSTTSS